MHDINATYDAEVLLPPYNTIWAQVIQPGRPARDRDDGRHPGIPAGRQHLLLRQSDGDPVRDYVALLGRLLGPLRRLAPAHDTGLNFVDPASTTGSPERCSSRAPLPGRRRPGRPHQRRRDLGPLPGRGDHRARRFDPRRAGPDPGHRAGIGRDELRQVPRTDDNAESILAVCRARQEPRIRPSSPTASPSFAPTATADPPSGRPVRARRSSISSQAIHGFHATTVELTCYDCHPGTKTLFHRSTAHTTRTGTAPICHGSLTTLTTMLYAGRVPWKNEPSCVNCHTFVAEVDTGSTPLPQRHRPRRPVLPRLPRQSPRPGPLGRRTRDHYRLLQYQNKALSLGSCRVCHSRLEGRRDSTGSWTPTAAASRRRAWSATRAPITDEQSLRVPPPVPEPEPLSPRPLPVYRDMRSTYVLRKRTASSARRKTGIPACSR